jgi:hypothetical protein
MTWCMRLVFAASVLLASVVETSAASLGDWPCVQRKVAEIALAAVWTGPQPDGTALKWRDDAAVASLVPHLAARRTTDTEAHQAIDNLAASSGELKQLKLLALLEGLVETINAEREAVIAGLERFGMAQKDLADILRKQNAGLSDLRNDAQADPAKLSQQVEQLQWTLRIFDERQKSLRFVCEVPTLLEQRLFALSKEIQQSLDKSK